MARTERSARRTTDHDAIQQWVESKGGHPAAVKGTGSGDDPGILRIDFPGFSGEGKLEELAWSTFFEWFDKNRLAFLYQDAGDSRFNKLVRRSRGDEQAPKGKKPVQKVRDEVRPQGGVNAIRLLEQQHREVESLFDEYEDSDDKLGVFVQIADALAAHSEIEERIFYPSIMASQTEEELREAVEEHLAVKRIIADLLKMEPSDPQFDSKVQVMRELVDHHVEEEETRLFKLVERIEPNALNALGEMMQTAYDGLIKEEPRKNVPKEIGGAAPL